MTSWVSDFVRRHHLEDRVGWTEALQGLPTARHVSELAESWGVASSEAWKALRFIHRENDDHVTSSRHSQGSLSEIRRLAAEHGLTPNDLLEILGQQDPAGIEPWTGGSAADARRLLDALDRLDYRLLDLEGDDRRAVGPIAMLGADSSGEAYVRLLHARPAQRYRIDRIALDQLKRQDPAMETKQVVQLVTALNHEADTWLGLLDVVANKQKVYLNTNDKIDLVVLSQSEVARAIRRHRSVVSRLIRGVTVSVNGALIDLKYLMPMSRDVVGRLRQWQPTWSASQISRFVAARDGLALSPRTVNYLLKPLSNDLEAPG